MYGGSAYAATPYAGGSAATSTPTTPTIPAGQIGRLRRGSAEVSLDVPVVALPAGVVRAVKVDKALAYPTPTLVNGRPT